MPVKDVSKRAGGSRQIFTKHKGERKGKFSQFAENVHLLKNRTQHHM